VIRCTRPTCARLLRRLVATIDRSQPIHNLVPFERIVAAHFARQRVVLVTMIAFAVLALLLGAVGTHGVLAFGVALRRREIGIRMALGGSRPAILRLVLGRAAGLACAGTLLGLPAAIALAAFIRRQLFDIGWSDLAVCAAAVVTVCAASMGASVSPALRSLRVDPMKTLRSE
jgi:putative ABC transport system permease protein